MPQYDLYVLCPECGNFHDALLRVSLDETFGVHRVYDVYDGRIPVEFYPTLAEMTCPITLNRVKQERADMMVLASK